MTGWLLVVAAFAIGAFLGGWTMLTTEQWRAYRSLRRAADDIHDTANRLRHCHLLGGTP